MTHAGLVAVIALSRCLAEPAMPKKDLQACVNFSHPTPILMPCSTISHNASRAPQMAARHEWKHLRGGGQAVAVQHGAVAERERVARAHNSQKRVHRQLGPCRTAGAKLCLSGQLLCDGLCHHRQSCNTIRACDSNIMNRHAIVLCIETEEIEIIWNSPLLVKQPSRPVLAFH